MVALGHALEVAALDRIIAAEHERFLNRMPLSAKYTEEAHGSLAGGVTSSWQISFPHPIWADRGSGSRLFDVDGNEYVDYHGGYGAMLAGHAHPAIVKAVTERVALGTHFAQPVHDAMVVAAHLSERYGLPLWRFGNSGTESTMDAIHLMRAVTGRDLIIKFEGAYHGHHDSVQVSTWSEEDLGPSRRPLSVPSSPGIPDAIVQLTKIAPFNDLGAVEEIFEDYPGLIAGVILEPVLMNCGILVPEEGFLEGVRALTRRHGALLTFDEVKTGLTVGRGGATRMFGVQPDIVCLAKALGGGLPVAAIGGTPEVMNIIVDGTYDQVGTFNGNPLGMAAARAMLTEVLVPSTYQHLERIEKRLGDGVRAIVDDFELPAYVVDIGAKGAVTYSPKRIRNYREFLGIDGRWALASWLTQFNRGVFLPPWTKGEQWLISVQHTDQDVDVYLETLEVFARAVSRPGLVGSPAMPGGAVQLVGLHKTFGETTAVDHINLEVAAGEFFSLLGPSGCGKTSTLRLIAGFERPTGGQILIDGVDMATTPPHLRPVNTVFQSYALFPHLTVGDNVAFGLKYHNLPKDEMSRRASQALELVRLGGLEKRKPSHLSGGQQQRVALARSLVLNPLVLLLDEPLGALDAKLRKALQIELKAIQENVGVTFIYVTHDQEEALTMSDRLAVMSEGQIEQLGTPSEVYEQPASAYVADFLGLSNVMPAEAVGPSDSGGCIVMVGRHELVAGAGAMDALGPVSICIRPERIVLGAPRQGCNELPGVIDRIVYTGPMLQVLIEVEGIGLVQAVVPNQGRIALARGEAVSVGMPEEALRVLMSKAGRASG